MRKFLFSILFFFLFFNYSQADIKEPGKINSLKCAVGALDAYFELQEYLEKKPKHKGVVYLACDTSIGEYSWTWQSSKNIEKAHTKAFINCIKNSNGRGTGECFLFSNTVFFSSSVTSLITLPGEPTTRELSGITLFSVIKAFAPMIQFLPIFALFKITAPIPIKLLSPIVHP